MKNKSFGRLEQFKAYSASHVDEEASNVSR